MPMEPTEEAKRPQKLEWTRPSEDLCDWQCGRGSALAETRRPLLLARLQLAELTLVRYLVAANPDNPTDYPFQSPLAQRMCEECYLDHDEELDEAIDYTAKRIDSLEHPVAYRPKMPSIFDRLAFSEEMGSPM